MRLTRPGGPFISCHVSLPHSPSLPLSPAHDTFCGDQAFVNRVPALIVLPAGG
jgi:hypothetical protein